MIEASLAPSGLDDSRAWVKLLAVWLIALLGLLTPNPLLTTAGIGVLPVLAALLWRPGEPPILLLVALNQWLQVFVPVLRADLAGQRVGEDIHLPEMELAAWLGLLAVVALAFGMRLGAGRGAAPEGGAIDRWGPQVKGSRLAAAYVAALALALALPEIAWLAPSLRQPVLVLGGLRWMAVFIILWLAATRSDLRLLAAIVVLVETIIGLGGYFSDFKTVYVLGAVALLSVRSRSSRIAWAGLAVVGVLAIGLGVVWQAVKLDYRPFLSQGERSQAVLVSPAERYGFLVERTLDAGGGGPVAWAGIRGRSPRLPRVLRPRHPDGPVADSPPGRPALVGGGRASRDAAGALPRQAGDQRLGPDERLLRGARVRCRPGNVDQHRLRGGELHRLRSRADVRPDPAPRDVLGMGIPVALDLLPGTTARGSPPASSS